jgi:hypothetical protein
MEPLSLAIPTFDEADTIGAVILEIPAAYVRTSLSPMTAGTLRAGSRNTATFCRVAASGRGLISQSARGYHSML